MRRPLKIEGHMRPHHSHTLGAATVSKYTVGENGLICVLMCIQTCFGPSMCAYVSIPLYI